MNSAKSLNRRIRIVENVSFVFAFGFIVYTLILSYAQCIHDSINGKGFFGTIADPILAHYYDRSLVAVIVIINSTLVLWEILSFIIKLFKQERGDKVRHDKYKRIFKGASINYKPSFLAWPIHHLLPKLILVNVFWIWLPQIQKFEMFTTNLKWYSWIYGYVCWEFAGWVSHFVSHRVRFLWCLHSPHHAPSELNMTVNWVHFFGEFYYSAFSIAAILALLGVNPYMLVGIVSIDSGWSVFVHVSERALKNGKLGILQHFLITPAHHRVHHAKNPLYIDTNFAFVLPLWDWIFGTLQPFKEDVKTDYGIMRDLDVTNFSDLYFGELLLLIRDVNNAEGIKNKLSYMVMPPGWAPAGASITAVTIRRDFLKINPELGVTSRSRFLTIVKSRFKMNVLRLKSVDRAG
jgi:sterol desaturase/sphingolipid hydroxylase (fatty acid hydroxylase superfamily)